ncbi:photosystem II reaction center protein Psb28 [uncultured Prochlorococcus sp.]|uniref:photosystem II reaction center protein Psb28 n=1 Tax=uncultured Prochlorococcus sp. TaxID=159733 RepID=UPI00258F19AB|nr:photosystem II reaction center protein Psb28 [uncultured Prochlorococcus sp.]
MKENKTAKIQFYEGTDEPVVPEIRLTRDKDGTTGQAFFLFEKPQALTSITNGEITGMRLIDSEGEILTKEVKVKFVDGEPLFLEAVYTWKTPSDFDRFMRFANSYAKSNGLGYSEKK